MPRLASIAPQDSWLMMPLSKWTHCRRQVMLQPRGDEWLEAGEWLSLFVQTVAAEPCYVNAGRI